MFKKNWHSILVILLILLGTIFQSVALFRSGQLYSYGVGYWGPLARDGVWHEALVGQLAKNVFPINPGFADNKLSNYHYFYDLVVSRFSLVTSISPPILIYRFFPVLFSILLGLGTYLLAYKLFKNKYVALVAVFLSYFASSFGWVIDLIRGRELGGESAFWANQPVSMNLNPPYAISIVIIVFAALLLSSFIQKRTLIKGIILIILCGTLIGFKVYGGVIVLFALFLVTLKKVIFDNNLSLLPIFLGSVIVALAIYFSESSGAASLLVFQPFWLIDTMIDASDRVGIPDFTSRRFTYIGSGKWLGLGIVELISFLIFLVGNLGTRIIGFWGLKKEYFKNDLHLFVITSMFSAFLPPLIFIQKGNPWNIVQFFYYFLFFAGLYFAAALVRIYRLSNGGAKAFVIIVLLVSPISSLATFRSWLYPNPVAYLSSYEYAGLKFLNNQDDGIVLKHPFNKFDREKFKDPFPLAVYADNAYVSAFGGKAVYLEDVEQQIVLNVDYKDRLEMADRFFSDKDTSWSNKFLKENNIKYIYFPKIYSLPMAEAEYDMKKIFENKEVNIYKVVQ